MSRNGRITSNVALCIALCVAASFAMACGPKAPTEAEARAWYEADAARIDAFDQEARRRIATDGLIRALSDEDPMLIERRALRARAQAGFREGTFPELASHLSALGAHVRFLDGELEGPLAQAGTASPSRAEGTVEPADGIEVGERKVGWGVYGVDDDQGGSTSVRGYEVAWEAEVEGQRLGFRLLMAAP